MSRIGRLPVEIPSAVQVTVSGQQVMVKGPKGELSLADSEPIAVEVADNEVRVARPDDERRSKQLHGLTRTLVNNMVVGVTEGYSKTLEVVERLIYTDPVDNKGVVDARECNTNILLTEEYREQICVVVCDQRSNSVAIPLINIRMNSSIANILNDNKWVWIYRLGCKFVSCICNIREW